ncbi:MULTISPECIES: GTPase [unclassified Moraxella]|uniref:GTPase n=1 Tax=unclassified Moraxella TaxID=2685852 RepID=UPI002B415756|nr:MULTISPECIES: GTPase [unclassified Moraxella]
MSQIRNLDIENPKTVYSFVKNMVDVIVQDLGKVQGNTKMDKESYQKSAEILQKVQSEIDGSVIQLENNAEWDTFSIAFFGETKAGKSTLIETLRILMKEKTKLEQQEQFNNLANQLGLSEDKYLDAKEELNSIQELLYRLNDKKSEIHATFNENISKIQHKKNDIEKQFRQQLINFGRKPKIKQKKHHKPKNDIAEWQESLRFFEKLFYIMIDFLRKTDAEKEFILSTYRLNKLTKKDESTEKISELMNQELSHIQPKINQLQQEKSNKLNQIEGEISNANDVSAKLTNWLNSFEFQTKQLEPYADGGIIGDGTSDFTKNITAYLFNISNQNISIFDVPGIEGNEKIVTQEINKAVQKAHAVIYVINKNGKPNEGTLEKIKSYLTSQTEVWAIYNKSIRNPKALKENLISNDNEKNALDEFETTLKQSLGQNYKGLLSIAGLPAFLSQAKCLVPLSQHFNYQKKFLENTDSDGLYSASKLDNLEKLLTEKIIYNAQGKIKKSNFNKVKVVLDKTAEQLKLALETSKLFEQDITKKVRLANKNIDSHFQTVEMQLTAKQNTEINNFRNCVRKEIYAYIDSDVSNDSFKSEFNDILKFQSNDFEVALKDSFGQVFDELRENIEKTQNELMHNIQKLSSDYQNFFDMNNSLDFDLDFNISNGINKMGLISVAIGIGMAIWWNPVGWVAISATALGLIFSFVKSVWGFFSSDYKKSQQKKNVDSNLPKVTKQMEKGVSKNIQQITQNLIQENQQIKQQFDSIVANIKSVNKNLESSILSLTRLSAKLDIN